MENAAIELHSRHGGIRQIALPPFHAGALKFITVGHVERYRQIFVRPGSDKIDGKENSRYAIVAMQDLTRAELSSLGRRTFSGIQEEVQRKVVQGLLAGDLRSILEASERLADTTRFSSQSRVSYLAGLM